MPAVTRRRAKAQADEESVHEASAAENEVSFQEPIPVRSKRKAASKAGKGDNATGDTKTATPKSNKKLEVLIRSEESATPTSSKAEIEVLIPSSTLKTPRSRSSPVPDSQDTTASQATDRTFDPLSASKQLEEEAIHTLELQSWLRKVHNSVSTPLPKGNKSSSASSGKKMSKGNNLASKPQSAEAEVEAEDEATPKSKVAAKSMHVVFGNDDDVDKFVAAAAEKEKGTQEARENDEDEDEEEDSDDEAPEAVSTAAAAKDTMKSARAAIEAAEKHAALAKRKRQERELMLQEQAEKRKRKRQRKPKEGDFSDDDDDDEENEEGEDEEEGNPAKRRRRTKGPLPDMLPEEFLTDSSSDDEEDDSALKKMVKRKKPKKINFETALQVLGAEGKGLRDEVVGSTRYRVLAKQGDERLAPKINKDSRRAKEALMRRGRQAVAANKKRGFFVKR